jgi:predicted membrane-bound spermidine synthase
MGNSDLPVSDADHLGPANQTWAIFLISVLGLFLEMLIIRWIGTEIRIFAYLQNTILVVCFLGLGLGCFTSRQPVNLRKMLFELMLLTLLLAIPITRQAMGKISLMLSVLGDLVIWHYAISTSFSQTVLSVALGLALTFFLMILILDLFIPIGRILGRLMDEHPNTIWAYSVNVAGSLVGTWLFVLLSFFYQPPVTWFLVFGGLTLFFLPKVGRERQMSLALLAGIIILAWLAGQEWGSLKVVWSPYQKLVVTESTATVRQVGEYVITVNNTGYQAMLDLSPSHCAADPEHFPPEMRGYSQYDIPLLLHPQPQKMLIVGAGSGNDAAGGLRHGVKEITAVDIDPAIISLGQRYHPEKPYAASAVKLVNDDARSFFATCQEKYDVIAFGLLDSHTTTAMTNARLDHYVYTRESITRARSLLADGGIMVLSFEALKPYIADRMAGVLQEVFGADPLCFRIPFSNYGWGGTMFVEGDLDAAQKQISRHPQLSSLISQWQSRYPVPITYSTKIATDDWPYIYLKNPSIPLLYYLLAGLLVLLFFRCRWQLKLGGMFQGWGRSQWHFFFLGAAFLLLEVQNISKAAVVFGNTWDVNAVIVSGVLAMILVANLIAHKFPRMPLGLVYTALCGICLLLYFLDLSRFAFLPYASKVLVVGGLTTLPMLFSGIVFIRSFAGVLGKDKALGANLIGALVGALLQSVTFVTGIRALLLIVAGLYFLSLLTRPQQLEQEEPQFHEAV